MSDPAFDRSVELLNDLYHRPFRPAAEVRLRRARFLLEQIGNPHRSFRSVHVTGSCGKGSTTTMIGSMLEAAGFRTGYFRSPHLETYRERIRVDGTDIPAQDWVRCFGRVWPVVEAMQDGTATRLRGYPAEMGRPALFEVLFALMALYFAEQGVQWAAVEAGLGGRLDATNLLQSDVAVVTNVSLEHTQILGNSVRAIAEEKAAIIKPGAHAVTAVRDPAALQVVESRAASVDAPLLRVGDDVQVHVRNATLSSQDITIEAQDHSHDVRLPLGGTFQAVNSATAFGAMLALRSRGIPVSEETARRGLQSVTIPGRFELISVDPLVILDGAHTPAAARELRASLADQLAGKRRILVFAAMGDKDLSSMAAEIGPTCHHVIVTRARGTERSASTASLSRAFAPFVSQISAIDDANEALDHALSLIGQDAALIVTGSLYLVGQLRRELAGVAAR